MDYCVFLTLLQDQPLLRLYSHSESDEDWHVCDGLRIYHGHGSCYCSAADK